VFTLYSSGGIDSYDEKYYPEMTEMKKMTDYHCRYYIMKFFFQKPRLM